VIADLKFGLRMLGKTPGFTAVAIGILALGIGAGTTMFSAINALLLRPLPVEKIDRLVCGYATREGFDPFETSLLEYSAYRQQAHSFTSSGLGNQRSFNLVTRGEPQQLRGAAIMADYLSTLGVKTIAGRLFQSEEDRPGGPAVVLLSHDLWQRLFGGDPRAIGQSLVLEDRSYTVIGILPPGFNMPFAADIWVPLQLQAEGVPLEQSSRNNYEMVARLRDGVTLVQADAELKNIARQLEKEYPQVRRGWSYKLVGLHQHLLGDMEGRTHKALFILAGAVAFLWLICCANLASLLLVRGVAREREISVRLALGATSIRIIRQLLVESLLLALFGGVGGVLLANWVSPLLGALSPIQAISLATFLRDFRIDSSVLGFAVALSLLAVPIFGLIPALRVVSAHDLMTVIKEREQRTGGASSGRRLLGCLVIAEIAIAATLLVSGGLMVQSFQRLQKIELGFRPDNLQLMEMVLSPNHYDEHRQRVAFMEQVLERVKALPGVISAGIATNVPLQLLSADSGFVVAENPPVSSGDVPITAHRLVSPGYLETLGVTLLRGRLLNEQDAAQKLPVVVVSEEFARQAWPGQDPIGKTIKRGNPTQTKYPWLTVVGMIRDIKEDRFNLRINRPAWYLPYAQEKSSAPLNLIVRTRGEPSALTAAVRDAIRSIDPSQPISNITTMKDHLAEVLIRQRFSAVLMGTLAAIGLILAVIGLYGVLATSVRQRTGEIGLRMALGARSRDILRLVLGHGLALILFGLLIGLFGAFAITRVFSAVLYEISPNDPVTFIFVTILLTIAALFACYLPARRAMKVDPMIALRHE
jgi:putative ABC transport system permease protein